MAPQDGMSDMRRKTCSRFGAAAIGAMLVAAPLKAESPRDAMLASDPFSALVGKQAKGTASGSGGQVVRYGVATGDRAFLVEGVVGAARIKFLCGDDDPRIDCTLDPNGPAEEIHLAVATRGPRGDVIYKGESGAPLLRIAAYGGATVFWPDGAGGEAASKSFGDDGPLVLPTAGRADVERRAAAAAARLSEIAGEPIVFTLAPTASTVVPPTDNAPATDDGVLADAIMRAAAGMATVADDPTGAQALARRVKEVRFISGWSPAVTLDGRALKIVYNPSADAAGRPSSRAVAEFLEKSL